jgi:hypothetical protein
MYDVAAISVTDAENLRTIQPPSLPVLEHKGRSETLTVTDVPETIVLPVLFHSSTVIVPDGDTALNCIKTAIASIVIAPGVKPDERAAELVRVELPPSLRKKLVLSTSAHVEAVVRLPVAQESRTAIG